MKGGRWHIRFTYDLVKICRINELYLGKNKDLRMRIIKTILS